MGKRRSAGAGGGDYGLYHGNCNTLISENSTHLMLQCVEESFSGCNPKHICCMVLVPISHTSLWRVSCFPSLGVTGYCNLEVGNLNQSQSVILQISYDEIVPCQIRRESIIQTFEF